MRQAFARSPLRLLTPANHGHAAWIYTSTYGGGLVDGDAIVLDVEVGEDAAAFVSTQASTKVYRSPHGTTAELRARIAPGGLLVVAPDPVVPYAAARYRQLQRFDVAEGASLVVLDWLASGRRAAGERWAFDEYESRLVVRTGGRLVVHEALALRAADGSLAERIGRFDIVAVVLLIGTPLGEDAAAIVSTLQAMPVVRRAGELVAVTPLRAGGCLVRIAGTSMEETGRTVRRLLGFVAARLGDDPWARKW